MPDADLLVSFRHVERNYHGLRPLRVRGFELRAGQSVAILGMDREPAEAFVNLVSAATLPDKGSVDVFGQPTSTISDNDGWMALLERIGILSERSMMLGEMTVEQNLAMPFSLEVYQLSRELQARVDTLAREVALPESVMKVPIAGLPPLMRARVRLARAVASEPEVLLAEHPNALVEEQDVAAFGEDITRVIAGRRLAAVIITANRAFAKAVADSLLEHDPATGDLVPAASWRRWWPRPRSI